MKTIKVAEATGPALDWLVARIEGDELPKSGGKGLDYSSDWAHGGPTIERELIDIQAKFNSGSSIVPKGQWYWQASTVNEDDVAYWFDGPTPLIAAMRCYVVSKLGDTAEVPEELV